ncbi:MAG: Crp/Fnr family transcriptional regulator [Bacteroidota bacterium]
MSTTSLSISLIRNHFPQVAEKALQEAIMEVGQLYHFQAGDTIMDFGSYIKTVPLVIKGSIRVMRENEQGKELLLYYLGAGDTCSMSFTCCMMHKQSIIRTIAEEDTTIIGIPVKYMDEWMSRFQSWKNFVMQSYDQRLLELVKVIDSISFYQMDERLWAYLQKKSKAIQSNTIDTTHQEIANDLNASREAISRLLKKLEKLGKVKLGRNQVVLL